MLFSKKEAKIQHLHIQLKGTSQVVPLVLQWNKQINLFDALVGV